MAEYELALSETKTFEDRPLLQAELENVMAMQSSTNPMEELLSCSKCDGMHVVGRASLEGCLSVNCLYCQQALPQIQVSLYPLYILKSCPAPRN